MIGRAVEDGAADVAPEARQGSRAEEPGASVRGTLDPSRPAPRCS